jgi:hypothetical protein
MLLIGNLPADLIVLQLLAPTFEFSPFVSQCFKLDELLAENGKLNEEVLQNLVGSVYEEPPSQVPVHALYVDMMIEVYVEILGNYIQSLVQNWREFNFT